MPLGACSVSQKGIMEKNISETMEIYERFLGAEKIRKANDEREIRWRTRENNEKAPYYNQPATVDDLLAEQDAWAVSEYELRGGALGCWWHNLIGLPWLFIIGLFLAIWIITTFIWALYIPFWRNIFTITGAAVLITSGIMQVLFPNN